jgi:hypothetical protein
MKLTLEEIWKMADLLEEAQKIKVGAKKLVQEEQPQTKERVLKLPKLQISENWGKLQTVERDELERIVDTATRGGKTPFERLRMIKSQMEQIASGADVKNPRRIISQIMLLETLNRLFKSFQPAPAGFINEAFLSVIYGSQQKAALQGNIEGDIGDITDNGIPVSLKTITADKPEVKGSVANLVNSINQSDKVYFDVYLKNSSGQDAPVGQLEVFRFMVDGSNINQFLQLSPGTIPTDANTGKLIMPKISSLNEGFLVQEQPEETDITAPDDLPQELKDLFQVEISKKLNSKQQGLLAFRILQQNSFILPKAGDFRKFINNLDSRALSNLISKLQQQPDSEQIASLKQYLAGDQISKSVPSKKGLRTEFIVPYGHWSKFAAKYGQKPFVIEFSDENLKKIIDNAVKSLDASITEIFNNLADFSFSLQNYLTSTEPGRGSEGLKAVELAKTLTPSTEKVVKDTAVD